ncbi:MAG: hypothetical protein ACPGGK_16915 [Pikeienuella sp.]
METLFNSLSDLGSNPVAWAVVGLVALKALGSIWMVVKCPIQCGTRKIQQEEAKAKAEGQFNPPLSMLWLTLAGIGLAVAGLYMISEPDSGPLALGMLVVGVFIFMTEPSRLRVTASMRGVFAATLEGAEAVSLAREELKAANMQRATIEFAIAAGLIGVLFFT